MTWLIYKANQPIFSDDLTIYCDLTNGKIYQPFRQMHSPDMYAQNHNYKAFDLGHQHTWGVWGRHGYFLSLEERIKQTSLTDVAANYARAAVRELEKDKSEKNKIECLKKSYPFKIEQLSDDEPDDWDLAATALGSRGYAPVSLPAANDKEGEREPVEKKKIVIIKPEGVPTHPTESGLICSTHLDQKYLELSHGHRPFWREFGLK